MNSDGDEATDAPVSGKRKVGAGLSSSPPRRESDESPLTLNVLRGLLEAQTVELRRSNQEEIQKVFDAVNSRAGKIEKDVQKHGDYLSQLRDDVAGMESRLHKVENQVGASMGSTGAPEADQKRCSLIMGGWPEDTQREILLNDIWELLHKLGLDEKFSDIFTTGPRRGFAIGNVVFPEGTAASDIKKQLIEMTVQIRRGQVRTDKMVQGKYLWANLSKPKAERDRGGNLMFALVGQYPFKFCDCSHQVL